MDGAASTSGFEGGTVHKIGPGCNHVQPALVIGFLHFKELVFGVVNARAGSDHVFYLL